MRRLLISFLLPVIFARAELCDSPQNERSTFLWSISSSEESTRSFLFGTIHVAYDRVWDSIPETVKWVLNRTDSVVFELALHDPSTVDRLIRCKQLTHGETLRNSLPVNVFERLHKYMSRLRRRLHSQLAASSNATNDEETRTSKAQSLHLLSLAQGWEVRRPVWLLFVLYQLGEEKTADSKMPMLDAFLAQQAQAQGKELLSIETTKEQCNPLTSINREQISFAINYTLSYLEWKESHKHARRKSSVDDLVRKYRCGSPAVARIDGWRMQDDGFSLSDHLDRQAHAFDNTLKADVIDHRNVRMAGRIHRLIREHPKRMFVFALGAGHFNGQFSLIELLKRYGYKVEEVRESDSLSAYFLTQDLFRNFKQLWIREDLQSRVHYDLKPAIPHGPHLITPPTDGYETFGNVWIKGCLLMFCVLPFIVVISRLIFRHFIRLPTHV